MLKMKDLHELPPFPPPPQEQTCDVGRTEKESPHEFPWLKLDELGAPGPILESSPPHIGSPLHHA